jgi:hypothetical protein
MPVNRMNREEFFSKLTGLDEERLKKALWNPPLRILQI